MKSDSMFILCVTLLIIMFVGDPDIIDAIIHYLGK